MEVNQWWICDRGRAGFHHVHEANRILAPSRKGERGRKAASWQDATAEIALSLRDIIVRHGARAVGVIGSGTLTNEEQFLTQAIFRDGLGIAHVDFPRRPQKEVVYSKFTIEGDKDPNARGAVLCGVGPGASGLGVRDMVRAAAEGPIKALIFLRRGLLDPFGEPPIVARAPPHAAMRLAVATPH